MSFEDISEIFEKQSGKLDSLFDAIDSRNDADIPQIIETYYHVINTASLAKALKERADFAESEKIKTIKALISERFDSVIHPRIMKMISLSVKELTSTLQSASPDKSRDKTLSDAKLFEKLRQSMSVKEFVEQYDRGIPHD